MIKKNYDILNDCSRMETSEIIDTIITGRGINDIDHFLCPEEDDMLSLYDLKNVYHAATLINDYVEMKGKIIILADTDVDGTTAGAIMYRYLVACGANVEVVINHGKAHGLIGQDLSRFESAELIIIVDSLDSNCDQYIALEEMGKIVIVLDHHDINPEIHYFRYVTLVSSQNDYNNPSLSGAGVVLKTCLLMDKMFEHNYADELFDLAACGILADVMDVSETSYENRYIIETGLNRLTNPGLKKIIGSYEFNSKSVLFSVAPLVNAAVRMGHSEEALRIFIEDDNKEILSIKKVLEECKKSQDEEKRALLPEVRSQFDNSGRRIKWAIINTPYGVSGLIGNTVLDEYNCPVFIWNKSENNHWTGSCRSIGYPNFRETMCSIDENLRGMGHEEAFGIEFDGTEEELFSAMKQLDELIYSKTYTQAESSENIDVQIELDDINRDLVDKIKCINRISGKGFKPITFKISDITDYAVDSWSEGKHLVIKPNDSLLIIKWNVPEGTIERFEDKALFCEPITVYGELDGGFVGRSYYNKFICNEIEED